MAVLFHYICIMLFNSYIIVVHEVLYEMLRLLCSCMSVNLEIILMPKMGQS